MMMPLPPFPEMRFPSPLFAPPIWFLEAPLMMETPFEMLGPEWRPPGLTAARDEIERRWGPATAARLTAENPRLVIEDGSVPLDPLA